jgi:hypothetical protein
LSPHAESIELKLTPGVGTSITALLESSIWMEIEKRYLSGYVANFLAPALEYFGNIGT